MNSVMAYQKVVLDSFSDGVVVTDNEGNLLLCNRAAEIVLGLESMNLPTKEWGSAYDFYRSDCVTPYTADDSPFVKALSGKTILNEVIFKKMPSGLNGNWISISAKPITNENGEAIANMVLLKDITERVQMLKQLSATEGEKFQNDEILSSSECKACLVHFTGIREKINLLTRAVQETADSILITDAQGKIIYVNLGFENKTGYSSNEVIGKTPRILKSGYHDTTFYNDLWGKISSGEHFRGTILNKKKNGETYWSDQTITPIKNEIGAITNYVSVLKDITDLIERERLERELELAAEIQMSILPKSLPTLPGFNIGASIKPARKVCGDFFDILPISKTKVGFLIGDVVDKGVTAAIIMARVHALIITEASKQENPGEILREVNNRLSYLDQSVQFTTAIYGILDCEKREFVYARAGHESPLILMPDGHIDHIQYKEGMALGIQKNIILDEQCISIPSGATLLLYTDGLADCCNSDMSLTDDIGLTNILGELGGLPAQLVCERILENIKKQQPFEEQFDDITLVALQANYK